MKRYLRNALLLCLVLLTVCCSCASAELSGFGMVNAGDVAIRKTPGGQRITRLQRGTCVWITGSEADSRGALWYHVRTQDSDNSNRTGWISAEFVDAGSALWHDIRAVKAAIFGMIALKEDGTVLCAGDNMFCGSQNRNAVLRDIRQAGFCTVGWETWAVDGSGRLFRDGTACGIKDRIRLAGNGDLVCITDKNEFLVTYEGNTTIEWVYPLNGAGVQLSHVTAMADCNYRNLFLTEDGQVFCAEVDSVALDYPEPDWSSWTDAVSIDASLFAYGTQSINGRTFRRYVPAFAAVRRDGTVLAAPAELAALTAGWQEIRKVAVGSDFILGLKQDGTVLAAGTEGRTPPDVSGWTDITDIANGHTYCVGLKRDGTLVFAGSFEFTDD